jgi:hypothetical protein
MTDKTAPRVSILYHPDVRLSLLTQKPTPMAAGALLYTADTTIRWCQHRLGADPEMAERINDLLLRSEGLRLGDRLPVLTIAADFGGSGYLQDYPIEQYIRDAKIDSLYEGTTAIQAQDIFFRKIARDQGAGPHPPAGAGAGLQDRESARPELPMAGPAGHAVADARPWCCVGRLSDEPQHDPRQLYLVGLVSVPFLLPSAIC